MQTIFIEKSYVIASIMNCKQKYINEHFVTFFEANFISYELQKEFNDNNIKAVIIDKIDMYLYDITNVIQINQKNNISLDGIKKMSLSRFKFNEMSVWEMMWDDSFILGKLIESRKKQLEILQNEHMKNDIKTSREKIKKFI